MTRDEIIEMARVWLTEFGIQELRRGAEVEIEIDELEAFAKLVAEREREACAVVAEEWFCGCGRGSCPEGDRRAHDIADSIRARGEAT